MSWGFIEEKQLKEVHYFLPRNWRNISNFNLLSEQDLKINNWFPIIEQSVEYDPETQEIYDYQLIFDNDKFLRVPLIRDKIETSDVIS